MDNVIIIIFNTEYKKILILNIHCYQYKYINYIFIYIYIFDSEIICNKNIEEGDNSKEILTNTYIGRT